MIQELDMTWLEVLGVHLVLFGVIYCFFYYYYLLLHRYASPTENRMVVTRAAVSGVGGCGEVMSRRARIMISRSEEVLAMEDRSGT